MYGAYTCAQTQTQITTINCNVNLFCAKLEGFPLPGELQPDAAAFTLNPPSRAFRLHKRWLMHFGGCHMNNNGQKWAKNAENRLPNSNFRSKPWFFDGFHFFLVVLVRVQVPAGLQVVTLRPFPARSSFPASELGFLGGGDITMPVACNTG